MTESQKARLTQVFWEGYKAYEDDMSLRDNPYRLNTLEASSWDEGWQAANEDS
jgi:ribosome modulation factor